MTILHRSAGEARAAYATIAKAVNGEVAPRRALAVENDGDLIAKLQASLDLEAAIAPLPEANKRAVRKIVGGLAAQLATRESEDEYAARQCDEDELIRNCPGLWGLPDQRLIDLIADPDADGERQAAAAILLARRLDGNERRVPR